MKFSPKCSTKTFGMIYFILGSFCTFFNWVRPSLRPKSGLGKSLGYCAEQINMLNSDYQENY